MSDEARHVRTMAGAKLSDIGITASKGARVISGSVLTGNTAGPDGYLGAFATQVVALPEGHDPKFLLTDGWLSPGLNKFIQRSRAYPTWLMPKSKEYNLDTNQNGEDERLWSVVNTRKFSLRHLSSSLDQEHHGQ